MAQPVMLGELQRAALVVKASLPRGGLARLARMRAEERLDPEEVERNRLARSARTASHAYRESPFYRELYRSHGFDARDVADPHAFPSLPVVTKDMVRESFERIKTPAATTRRTRVSISSGSTGNPLRMLSDRRIPMRAARWRLYGWWGVSPWENDATIDRTHNTGAWGKLRTALWYPTRRLELDTLDLSDEVVDAFVRQWQLHRPACVTGFIPGVVAVARMANARGLQLHAPKAVGVTAGPLVPGQRAEISRAFGAPVYDHYRSSEGNYMAGQCEERAGLHTFDDIKNIEILRDDLSPTQPAEFGSTVFTDFENRAFPMVRYVQGDRAAWIAEACACGRPFRTMTAVDGRVTDYLTLPSGTVLVGDLLGMFEGCNEFVRQFQLYQGRDHQIEVRCILTSHPRARERAEARVAELRLRVRGEVGVTLHEVGTIAPIRGKYQYIISDAPRAV